jgi:hypothetical protein
VKKKKKMIAKFRWVLIPWSSRTACHPVDARHLAQSWVLVLRSLRGGREERKREDQISVRPHGGGFGRKVQRRDVIAINIRYVCGRVGIGRRDAAGIVTRVLLRGKNEDENKERIVRTVW